MDHLIEITHGYSVGRDSECFLALKAHLDLAIVPVTVLVPVSLTVAVFVFVVMPLAGLATMVMPVLVLLVSLSLVIVIVIPVIEWLPHPAKIAQNAINVIIVFFILSEYMFLSEYLSYKYPKIIE